MSAAQQPQGDASQSHEGRGPASAAATPDLEARKHQNGAAPTRSQWPIAPLAPFRQSLPGAPRLPAQATKHQMMAFDLGRNGRGGGGKELLIGSSWDLTPTRLGILKRQWQVFG